MFVRRKYYKSGSVSVQVLHKRGGRNVLVRSWRIEAHICICFVAYKLYKELERLLHALDIPLSVDRALDIAKTISTLTVSLPDDTTATRLMLISDEQHMLQPHFPPNL